MDWKTCTDVPNNLSLVPILPGNYSTILVYLPLADGEAPGSDKAGLAAMDLIEDVYKLSWKQDHENFIMPTTAEPLVISVKEELCKGNYHKALITHKRGYHEFDLTIGTEDLAHLNLIDRLEKNIRTYLSHNATSLGFTPLNLDDLYHVPKSESFRDDLMKIEKNHCQKKEAMKIGVIYGKKGQASPQDMFQNGADKCSQPFLDFINIMGEVADLSGKDKYMGDMKPGEVGAYYNRWNAIEIIYHVAPLLTAEGHRRLIGNDIAELFFLDEGEDFLLNPVEVSKLGTVPQIFAVVQPVKSLYRVGFFTNKNIKKFGPNIPSALLTPEDMKNFILTKTYNGLVMCNKCPPMNRLFYVPRQESLNALVAKYPPEKGKKKKKNVFNKPKLLHIEKGSTASIVVENSFESLSEWPEPITLGQMEEEKEEPEILKSHRENLFKILEGALEILISDKEIRKNYLNDITKIYKEDPKSNPIQLQLQKFEEIGIACSRQGQSIESIEKPVSLIQQYIVGWNKNFYSRCIINRPTNSWDKLITSLEAYSKQLDTLINSYKKPLKGSGNTLSDTQVHQMFYLLEDLSKLTHKMLDRLEKQYSYSPIIFGVGNIFSHFYVNIQSIYTNYVTSFHLILEAWEDVMNDDQMKSFVLQCQKQSIEPEVSLPDLLVKPIRILKDLPITLSSIACELLRIDTKFFPTALIYSPRFNGTNELPLRHTFQKRTHKRSKTHRTNPSVASPSSSSKRRHSQNSGVPKFLTKSHGGLALQGLGGVNLGVLSGSHRSPRATPAPTTTSTPPPIGIITHNSSTPVATLTRTRTDPVPPAEEDTPPRTLKRTSSKREKTALKKKTQSVGDKKQKLKAAAAPKAPPKDLYKLHEAIHENNLNQVTELIKHDRALVSATDRGGKNPLHLASVGASLPIIKYLHKNGTPLDEQDSDGFLPLHYAASFANYDALEYLVKGGADPWLPNKEGNTCLHLFGRSRKMVPKQFAKLLDLYLKAGGNINAKNNAEETFLHTAVAKENIELIGILLKRNASVNEADLKGNTPLKIAEAMNHAEMLNALKNPGSLDSLKDKLKKKGEDLAMKSPDDKQDRTKKPADEYATALMNSNFPVLKELFKSNVDINAKVPSRGDPPLHLACGDGNLPLVEFLLKNNAQIVANDPKQLQWPIHSAAISKHWEVVNFLIQKGHPPDVQNVDLNTCLHYVVRNSLTDSTKSTIGKLYEAGANLDARNKQGETPLIVAIQIGGSPDMCRYLIELGASVTITTNQGYSPIACCDHYQRKDLVEIIESETANPHRIKIDQLYKDLYEIEADSFDGPCNLDYFPEEDTPLYNEIRLLWSSSRNLKKLYIDSIRKLACKYLLNSMKDQLIQLRSELDKEVPTYLFMQGMVGTKTQPLVYYLFDNLLILGTFVKSVKSKTLIKHIIPRKSICSEDMKYEEEAMFVQINFIAINKQPIDIPVPDLTFYNALKYEGFTTEADDISSEAWNDMWLDNFLYENRIPMGIGAEESGFLDDAYSELSLMES